MLDFRASFFVFKLCYYFLISQKLLAEKTCLQVKNGVTLETLPAKNL